jgi:protein ImuA
MPRDPFITVPDRFPLPSYRRDRLASLHDRIRRIERNGREETAAALLFGVTAIDNHLPAGGLARGALHELTAQRPGDGGAVTDFCAALLGRILEDRAGTRKKPVLWCLQDRAIDAGEIYPPGLAWLRLDAARLLAVRARRDTDVLWTMEEGLRCTGLAAVVGEVRAADLTASRRLQLAAEAGGIPALLLRPASDVADPSAAMTRWRIAAAPSRPRGWAAALDEPGPACWWATLFRCRGGAPGRWLMEWHDETGDLALAAPVRDRPGKPRDASLAG